MELMICTYCVLGDFSLLFRLRLFISSELQYTATLVPGIAEEHCEISHHNSLLEKSQISQTVQRVKGVVLGNMQCSVFCTTALFIARI